MRVALVGLLLLVFLAPSVRAEEPVRVAVLPLEAGADDVGIGAVAADLVSATLAGSDNLLLVEREAVDAVLAERALAGAAEGLEGIGRLLPADVLVTGAVGAHEDGWRLTLEASRIPGGTVLGAVSAVDDRAHLGRAVEKAVEKLRISLGARPARVREVTDRAAAASLQVLRGFGYARAGLHVEAIGAFLEARRLAARLPETHFWMGRSYLAAGQPEHAGIALRAFLADVPPWHPLTAEASTWLTHAQSAQRAEALEARASSPRSLTEVLLSDASNEERRAAVEATIARGREGAAELAAAIELPYENDLADRILLGLADVDPERFVRAIIEVPERVQAWPGDVRKRFEHEFTPAVAERAAKSLASAHAIEREGVKRFFGHLIAFRFPEATLEPYRAAIRRAGASQDETLSLEALRLDPTNPENAAVIAERLADERYSPKYRAELVALCPKLVFPHPEIFDLLLEMLGDENEEIRRAAGLNLGWGLRSPPQGRRDWAQEARRRVARRAGELIASRRFPEDAKWLVYAGEGMAQVPNASVVIPELLASKHPAERGAALQLLRRGDRPVAYRAAKALLHDHDHENVQLAIAVLAETGDLAETESLLLRWWRASAATEGEAVELHRLYYESSLEFAFQTLARRIDPRVRHRPPPRGAGLDAWAAFLEGARAAKEEPVSGVERER